MLRLRPLHPELSPFSVVYLIVTWFQSGRIRPASGSWGSLAAAVCCWIIQDLGGWQALFVFMILSGGIGLWAVKQYARKTDNPDPSEVVIDEVLGFAIVGLLVPFSMGYWIIGFILFRLFDSIKRGPVGWCDKNIKGPLGVMIDDVVAGLFAGFLTLGLSLIFG